MDTIVAVDQWILCVAVNNMYTGTAVAVDTMDIATEVDTIDTVCSSG